MPLAVVRIAGFALVLTAALPAAAEEPARFHDPGGALPKVLDGVALPEGLIDLAVSDDGRRAVLAAAVERPRGGHATSLSILEAGAAAPGVTSTLEGRFGGLIFLGDDLLAIEHHPAKRREGDTYLVHIDPLTARVRRELRLPTSASDLAYWPSAGSLVVSVRNELRTLLLPSFQSGPLFRLPGANLCVVLVRETEALVGQEDALLLVDLATPQTRDGLPVRERLAAPGPVTALAVDATGERALARLADDRVFAVDSWPLAWHAVGRGAIVARPRTAAARSTEAGVRPERRVATAPLPAAPPGESPRLPKPEPERTAPALDEPEPESAKGEPEAEPELEPETDAVEAPPPATPTPVPTRVQPEPEWPEAQPEPAPEPEPEPAGEPEPRHESNDTVEAAPPAPPPPAPPARTPTTAPAQLRGRVTGPSAATVVAVVVLGPDNLLREAARAAPGADGRFELSGLAPGRYRVQLDGGRHVPISRPGFHLIEIGRNATPVEIDFQVLGAM